MIALSEVTRPSTKKGVYPLRLSVSFANTRTALFGPAHTIVTAPVLSRAQIAVAPNGAAIVAWVEQAGKRRIVRASVRAPGGSFSKPGTLSGAGQAEMVAVAAGARGDFAVVAVRSKKLVARVKRPGHRWGAIQTLAPANGPTQWLLTAAIGPTGRVVVVWRPHVLTKNNDPRSRTLQTTYMPAGSFSFHRGVQELEDSGASAPFLLTTARGFALAWTKDSGVPSPTIARVALAGPASSFGAPIDASAAIGGLRDVRLAASPDGDVYAVWIEPQTGGDSDGLARGALLPFGASAFGAPEQVSPSENVHEAAVAYDPTAYGFYAVWTARPDGTGPGIPVAQLKSVVRTATRA